MDPWHPINVAIDLKHLGKLAEELNECGSATARCIIQGMDGCEPESGKPNRQWLQEEIADVLANVELVARRDEGKATRILARRVAGHGQPLDGSFVLTRC